jgi:hypothetical protein
VLRPMERKLFQALKRAGDTGRTNAELMDDVYRDDPNGGALGSNIVAVMASEMRKAMAPFGMTIRASRGGRGARYHLEKL